MRLRRHTLRTMSEKPDRQWDGELLHWRVERCLPVTALTNELL